MLNADYWKGKVVFAHRSSLLSFKADFGDPFMPEDAKSTASISS
jgi:hypothetical protein